MCRYRCGECGHVWHQDNSLAAEAVPCVAGRRSAGSAQADGPPCHARGPQARSGGITGLVRRPAREHRPITFKPLTGNGQAEAVESGEGGQLRAAEAGLRGSAGQVEVLQMVSVELPPSADLDPYPAPTAPPGATASTVQSRHGDEDGRPPVPCVRSGGDRRGPQPIRQRQPGCGMPSALGGTGAVTDGLCGACGDGGIRRERACRRTRPACGPGSSGA